MATLDELASMGIATEDFDETAALKERLFAEDATRETREGAGPFAQSFSPEAQQATGVQSARGLIRGIQPKSSFRREADVFGLGDYGEFGLTEDQARLAQGMGIDYETAQFLLNAQVQEGFSTPGSVHPDRGPSNVIHRESGVLGGIGPFFPTRVVGEDATFPGLEQLDEFQRQQSFDREMGGFVDPGEDLMRHTGEKLTGFGVDRFGNRTEPNAFRFALPGEDGQPGRTLTKSELLKFNDENRTFLSLAMMPEEARNELLAELPNMDEKTAFKIQSGLKRLAGAGNREALQGIETFEDAKREALQYGRDIDEGQGGMFSGPRGFLKNLAKLAPAIGLAAMSFGSAAPAAAGAVGAAGLTASQGVAIGGGLLGAIEAHAKGGDLMDVAKSVGPAIAGAFLPSPTSLFGGSSKIVDPRMAEAVSMGAAGLQSSGMRAAAGLGPGLIDRVTQSAPFRIAKEAAPLQGPVVQKGIVDPAQRVSENIAQGAGAQQAGAGLTAGTEAFYDIREDLESAQTDLLRQRRQALQDEGLLDISTGAQDDYLV